MSFSYLGSRSLGQCVPLGVQAQLGLDASIGIVLPQLEAQLAGAIELDAQLKLRPPSLNANIDACFKLIAAMEASISVGLPGIDFQLAAVAELLLKIQADIGSLSAQLALSANLGLVFGTGGVLAYRYSGTSGAIAADAQNAFGGGLPIGGGPSAPVAGFFFIASTPAAREAMDLLFG